MKKNLPQILPKPAYSIAELEQILGIGHSYIYKLINEGELRTFTLGKRRFASMAAVNELIARREKVA